MKQLSVMVIAGALLLPLLSACAGGSYGGAATTTAPTAPAATTATSPLAQAAAAATKELPTIDTAAAEALLSPDQTLQIVNFASTGSTTVSGKIVGYKSTVYAVQAIAGQTLTVTMTTPSDSAYFNVKDVRDQSGAAVHRGDVDGAKATVSVPASTTYLIDPFLVRAVARRGSSADYTLTISRQ